MERCNIFGVKINVTDMSEAIKQIGNNIKNIKGNYICISNVHTTVMAYEDMRFKEIQNESFMSLPDGKPLSVVSHFKGYKTAERVTGPDLMEEIFKISKIRGYSHFFYGSTEDTLEKMNLNLLIKYPELNIIGRYSPPFRKLSEEEDKEIIERINNLNPDFLWVGLGAPKQEVWMFEHRNIIKALMIGVGAGFDYYAGNIKRAPMWMQRISMEWFYRLIQEPKKLWRRYLSTNFKFLLYLFIGRRQK
jgi:N-acetylglucosaminyldiphosphoundecaprenol N-acetyl-beta-D-mannosaminyltransferase